MLPLTGHWKSTPLVPLCLLEKPTLTLDPRVENPKLGRVVWTLLLLPGSWSELPRGPEFLEVLFPPWAAWGESHAVTTA